MLSLATHAARSPLTRNMCGSYPGGRGRARDNKPRAHDQRVTLPRPQLFPTPRREIPDASWGPGGEWEGHTTASEKRKQRMAGRRSSDPRKRGRVRSSGGSSDEEMSG
eukprot:1019050-Rhodomonas_salina.2